MSTIYVQLFTYFNLVILIIFLNILINLQFN